MTLVEIEDISSLLASGGIGRVLITFANSSEPDQNLQCISPDLDPNRLTLWKCSQKAFWRKKVNH